MYAVFASTDATEPIVPSPPPATTTRTPSAAAWRASAVTRLSAAHRNGDVQTRGPERVLHLRQRGMLAVAFAGSGTRGRVQQDADRILLRPGSLRLSSTAGAPMV